MFSIYLIFGALCGIMSLSCIVAAGEVEHKAGRYFGNLIGFIFFVITYFLIMGALELIRKVM